jgi:predicted lipid-binding transport protein (Tim44 family)
MTADLPAPPPGPSPRPRWSPLQLGALVGVAAIGALVIAGLALIGAFVAVIGGAVALTIMALRGRAKPAPAEAEGKLLEARRTADGWVVEGR